MINSLLLRVHEGINLKEKTEVLTSKTQEFMEKYSIKEKEDRVGRMLNSFEQNFSYQLARIENQ